MSTEEGLQVRDAALIPRRADPAFALSPARPLPEPTSRSASRGKSRIFLLVLVGKVDQVKRLPLPINSPAVGQVDQDAAFQPCCRRDGQAPLALFCRFGKSVLQHRGYKRNQDASVDVIGYGLDL